MFLFINFLLIMIISKVSGKDYADLYKNEIQSGPVVQKLLSNYNKAVTVNEDNFSEERSFDVNNLSTAYNNLVNSSFIFKAILIYIFHLLFQTVGWFLTSLVWNIGRGGSVDLDPDIAGAVGNGLLDSDFAATNLALGAGQFAFYFLLWSAVVTYGNINSLGRKFSDSYQEENTALPSPWSGEYPAQGKTDLQLTNNQLGAALDDLFSPATVTKQFVINILGAIGGTIFISLMSFLPESSDGRKRREIRKEEDLTFKMEHFLDRWS